MINSRTHAQVDLYLSAALAGLAVWPTAAPRVRWAAATAALYQASYGVLTDYEGGILPSLGLKQHQALALAGAGLLGLVGAVNVRRQGAPLLLAAAAAQFAVAMAGETHTHAGPPDMTYQPLDTPKRVVDDVWTVDSAVGPGIPVRMTVVRLRNGDLLLHSPTRYSPALREALEALGTIRHLIAPNIVHWVFLKSWQDAVPGTVVWAAPGLRQRRQVRRSGLRIDHDLSDRSPPAWDQEIEQAVIPGGGPFTEVAMLHRPSRTLLMTDLVQNFEREKLPWVLRPIASWLGNLAPAARAPAHVRAVVLLRHKPAKAAMRRVIAWAPQRVMVTHGLPVEEDAARRLRQSFAWLVAT